MIICLSGEGFEPPTFGLWAQHASSAPPRFKLVLHDVFKPISPNIVVFKTGCSAAFSLKV